MCIKFYYDAFYIPLIQKRISVIINLVLQFGGTYANGELHKYIKLNLRIFFILCSFAGIYFGRFQG